ncbi:MAG: metal transporter [Deltaproteobacteria bacterium]|nr:metal transporter [Deltaproteobacteria bacterium]
MFRKNVSAFSHLISASQNYLSAMSKYANDFMLPYLIAISYFNNVEKYKVWSTSPLETVQSYMDLLAFNLDLISRGISGGMEAINISGKMEMENAIAAMFNTLFCADGEDLEAFLARQTKMMDVMANRYPQAIQDIEPKYGFHFERDDNKKVAETDRFILYQILPTDKKVKVNKNGKPVLILPPYVLGANIPGFLPYENKSYTHCFANQGIPTYIRILKDINTTEAVQVMTGEDDALDTRLFCEKVKKRHGKPVTLNGYCQGGFFAVCNLLSGELDGLVDALITCVAPIDGTKSRGLANFFDSLPQRFYDLAYGTKTLPNGNKVVDGKLMGWIYKLKSIGDESPVATFYRNLMMFGRQGGKDVKISKTAAAINYWMSNERNDLPIEITHMSFVSYNIPITKNGTLPVTLFGRKLNLKRLQEKGIQWLICYGESDDLVEKETALAPLDYIDVEVTPFPKGHVAIATSWSNPTSACALHTRFGDKNYRGPVRFQLDLEDSL